MSATFTVNGGNTTITFTYTTTTALIQSIVGDAAEQLYNQGVGNIFTGDPAVLVPFASLTNQQKLNAVDIYIRRVIVDSANNLKANKSADTARATQDGSKYTL